MRERRAIFHRLAVAPSTDACITSAGDLLGSTAGSNSLKSTHENIQMNQLICLFKGKAVGRLFIHVYPTIVLGFIDLPAYHDMS